MIQISFLISGSGNYPKRFMLVYVEKRDNQSKRSLGAENFL